MGSGDLSLRRNFRGGTKPPGGGALFRLPCSAFSSVFRWCSPPLTCMFPCSAPRSAPRLFSRSAASGGLSPYWFIHFTICTRRLFCTAIVERRSSLPAARSQRDIPSTGQQDCPTAAADAAPRRSVPAVFAGHRKGGRRAHARVDAHANTPHLAVGVERTRGLASERTTLGKLAEATEFECLVVCGLRSGDDLGAGEEWADGDVEGDIGWYRFGNTAGRFISDPGH